MIKKILESIKGKKIALLGMGIEGMSTYNFIRRYSNMHLTLIDENESVLNSDMINADKNISKIYGSDILTYLKDFDLVIKSPGIVVYDEMDTSKITSQLDLILMCNKDNIIGITGTKGKSTTSSLVYEVIKANNKDVLLLGNIGMPIFDKIESIKKDTILVIEMSSHQLQYINYSPRIAIILNLLEDHLDYCKTVECYHKMKLNICKFQNEEDFMVYLSKQTNICKYLNDSYKARKIEVNVNGNIGEYDKQFIELPNIMLYGEHNKQNAIISLVVQNLLNLDMSKSIEAVMNFKGLEHRLELVGTFNGITYYNDSIATIPEATISAVNALGNVDTLIIGGLNRGINYTDFITFLCSGIVRNIVCMPTTGIIIEKEIKKQNNEINTYLVNNMQEAVKISKQITVKGKECLFSPAASSYDFYKSFKDKGNHFKELVREEE